MRLFSFAFVLNVGVVAAGNSLHAALDEICAFHNKDNVALSRTLESLTEIATHLQSEPENPKYRNIRLLNKTFWERVGSVNGGISFMSSLGFDLLGQGGFASCTAVVRHQAHPATGWLPHRLQTKHVRLERNLSPGVGPVDGLIYLQRWPYK